VCVSLYCPKEAARSANAWDAIPKTKAEALLESSDLPVGTRVQPLLRETAEIAGTTETTGTAEITETIGTAETFETTAEETTAATETPMITTRRDLAETMTLNAAPSDTGINARQYSRGML